MYTKAPIVLPKLRFKGFDGEWEEKEIEFECKITRGKKPKPLSQYVSSNFKIPWIKISDLKNNKFLCSTNDFFDENNVDKTLVVPMGSLVYTIEGSPCIPFFINMNFAAIDNHLALIECNPSLNENFFYYILLKNRKNFSKFIIGSTLTAIPIKQLKESIIFLPSLQEQTKIAHFFSLLDKQIELWENKLQLVELKKKNYMKLIFSLNINFLPRLRFQGFEGEWEEKQMKDISVKCRAGGTPKADNKEYYLGTIPFLSISDINSKYLTTTNKSINEIAINNSSSFIIPKNNLLLSIYATIGIVCITKVDVAIPQSILGIILKSNFNLEFTYYLLLNSKRKLNKYIQTGSQPNLNLDNVNKINFKFPSLQEQTKISNFLSIYDKLLQKINKVIITNKKNKIHYLNTMFL